MTLTKIAKIKKTVKQAETETLKNSIIVYEINLRNIEKVSDTFSNTEDEYFKYTTLLNIVKEELKNRKEVTK